MPGTEVEAWHSSREESDRLFFISDSAEQRIASLRKYMSRNRMSRLSIHIPATG